MPSESMTFGEWLQAEMSTEEKWAVETIARREDPRTAMLYRLCCQQQFQIQKAVNEIARLELLLMDASRQSNS
jgi:hypothetical protein